MSADWGVSVNDDLSLLDLPRGSSSMPIVAGERNNAAGRVEVKLPAAVTRVQVTPGVMLEGKVYTSAQTGTIEGVLESPLVGNQLLRWTLDGNRWNDVPEGSIVDGKHYSIPDVTLPFGESTLRLAVFDGGCQMSASAQPLSIEDPKLFCGCPQCMGGSQYFGDPGSLASSGGSTGSGNTSGASFSSAIPASGATIVGQPSMVSELPRVHNVAVAGGARLGVYWVTANATVTWMAELGRSLGSGEVLKYSLDSGASWTALPAGAISDGVMVRVENFALQSPITTLYLATFNGAVHGQITRQLIGVDVTGPTASLSAVLFNELTAEIIFAGSNLQTVLGTGETYESDIRERLDWGKLFWDTLPAGAGRVTFAATDIVKAQVTSADRLSITLTDAKLVAIRGMSGYGAGDQISVDAGFLKDPAGHVATGDQLAAAAVVLFGPSGDREERFDVYGDLRFAFPAAIARGVGQITLYREGGEAEEVFDAATSSALRFEGTQLIIDPTWPLLGSSNYSVGIAAGSIVDGGGNPLSGIFDTSSLSFTTGFEITGVVGATAIRDEYPGSFGVESIGNHRALYIPVTFTDQHKVATSLASMRRDDVEATADFFIENSQGAITFNADYTPLVTLPYSHVWHEQFDSALNGLALLMSQSQSIAKDMGYDPSNYEVTILRFGDRNLRSGGSWGGGNSVWLGWGGMGVTAHEVGHALGLPHAKSTDWSGNIVEYGNQLDVMGGEAFGRNADFIVERKVGLGWVESAAKLSEPGPGIYRLHGMDQTNRVVGQYYGFSQTIAQDVLGANPTFTLEYRPTIGPLADSAVLLRNNQIIDLTPQTSTQADGGIAVGQTYQIPGSNTYFTVMAKGDGFIDVAYQRGPFADNVAPSASLYASATTVAPAGSVTFAADAFDANGDSLVYFWEFTDGVKGSGPTFTRTFTQIEPTTVTAKLTVSDMKGGTATRSVVINAGAASTSTPQTVGSVTGVSLSKPRVAVVSTDAVAAEGGDAGAFTFRRIGTSISAPLTLNVSFGGSAIPGANQPISFIGLPTTVVIPAGQSETTLSLEPLNDEVIEPNKNLTVTIGASVNYVISGQNASASLSLVDDDTPVVTIEAADAVATEGSLDSGVILIRRTGPTDLPVTVYYGLTGDAFNGGDYGRLGGQIVIPVGASVVALPIVAIDDELGESSETVTVHLTAFNNSYGVGSASKASVAIRDNGDLPQVTVRVNGTALRDEGEVHELLFEVVGGSGEPVTVHYSIGGTATGGTDYKPLGGSIELPTGGSQSVTLPIETIIDGVNEFDESVTVKIDASPNYVVGLLDNAQVAIAQPINVAAGDDRVHVSRYPGDPTEGTSADVRFFVYRDNSTSSRGELTVNFSLPGTTTPGTDFSGRILRTDGTLLASFTPQATGNSLVIPANTNGVLVVLDLVDDSVAEGTESVKVRLDSVSGTKPFYPLGINREEGYLLADNDTHVTRVGFASGGSTGEESATPSARIVSLPVVLSQASDKTVTVKYGPDGGSATGNGVDYFFVDAAGERLPATGGILSFAPGVTTQSIRLRLISDSIPEDGETIRVLLESPTDASLSSSLQSHMVTIFDALPSGLVKEERWGGTGVFTNKTWDAAPPSVTQYLDGLTPALDVGNDYSRRLTGLVTAPVTGTYTFYIAADDDARLYLGSSAAPGSKSLIASVNGWTDFQEWNRSSSQASTSVTLTAGQSYYVEVQHMDIGGLDHVSVGWKLPGSTGIVPITTASNYASVERRTARFVSMSSTAQEASSVGTEILVTLDRPNPEASTTVMLEVDSAVSSAGGSDYVLSSLSITFAPGEISKRVPLSIASDSIGEGVESLRLKLASASGALIASPRVHDLLIIDENAPTIAAASGAISRVSEAGTDIVTASALLAAGRTVQSWQILAGNSKLSGSSVPAFAIDNTGRITLANPVALPAGAYDLRLIVGVTDSSGSSASGVVRIVIAGGGAGAQVVDDAPRPIVVTTIDPYAIGDEAETDSGTSASIRSGETTRDNTLRISGSAGPGDTVRLYSGELLIAQTVADIGGAWTLMTPVLGDGEHLIRAEVLDDYGNVGVTTPLSFKVHSQLRLDGTALLSSAGPNGFVVQTGSTGIAAVKAVNGSGQGVVVYELPIGSLFEEQRWAGGAVYDNNSWETQAPVTTSMLASLTPSQNVGSDYSRRIRGTITATATGAYTFYIAADDEARLFLGTTSAADSKSQIASVDYWTDFQNWTDDASQKSVAIQLTANQTYYIEVQHKEGGGGDHVSVAWTSPGISEITPITVPSNLVTVDASTGAIQIVNRSASDSSVAATETVKYGGISPDGRYVIFGTSDVTKFGNGGTSYGDSVSLKSGPYSDILVFDRSDSSVKLVTSATAPNASRSRQAEFVGVSGDSKYVVYTTDHVENIGNFSAPGKGSPTWTVVQDGFPTVDGKAKSTAVRVADLDPSKLTISLSGAGISSVSSQLFEEQRWSGQTVYGNDTWGTVAPSGSSTLTGLTPPRNVGSDYSRRLRGTITAPATGEYRFYIASDDASRLFLSTTSSSAQAVQIASVSGYTGFQSWSNTAPRRSEAITLQAGQKYYIEVRHQEGGGSDHVSVAWTGPGITSITPIAVALDGVGLAASASAATIRRPASGVLTFWAEAVDDGVTKAVELELTDTSTGILVKALRAKTLAGSQSNVDWNNAGTATTLATEVTSSGIGVGVLFATGNALTSTMIDEVGLSAARDIVAVDIATGAKRLLSHSAEVTHRESLAADVRDVTVSNDGRYVIFSATDATKIGNNGVAFTESASAVRDWFAADLESGVITMLSHAAGNMTRSAGAALSYVGTSDEGDYAIFSATDVSAFGFTDANTAIADFVAVRLSDGQMRLITRASSAAATTTAGVASVIEWIQGKHVYFRAADATRFGFTADGSASNQDLFRFDLTDGSLRLISHTTSSVTSAFHGSYEPGSAVASPDGRFVTFEANLTGSGSGFTVSINGRAQLIVDTQSGTTRLLNSNDAGGTTLWYAAWGSMPRKYFTPDSKKLVYDTDYLGWQYVGSGMSYSAAANNQFTYGSVVLDLSGGVSPAGTGQKIGELLSHASSGLNDVAEGGDQRLLGISQDGRIAFFQTNDISRFGNDGIAFEDQDPNAADILLFDLQTRRIGLVTGNDLRSFGMASTFLGSSEDGGVMLSGGNLTGVRTPSGEIVDPNATATDLLLMRTRLIALASPADEDGSVGAAFTLESWVVPGMGVELLQDGQVIARQVAGGNGRVAWQLTNVPHGRRSYTLRYPGEAIPIGSVDPVVASSLSLTVARMNNAPTGVALSHATIAENAGVNAVVGTLSTTDPDADENFTYSLVGGDGDTDNAAFSISGSQLRANTSFDFETKNTFFVRVRATDAGGLSVEKSFTITVTDINEWDAGDIVVNEGSGYAIFTVSGTAGLPLTLDLVNASGGTGAAELRSGGALPSLMWWDGVNSTWQAYGGTPVPVSSSGTIKVRVATTAEQDAAYEGPETFRLNVSTTSGTPIQTKVAKATIVDNAGGLLYGPGPNDTGTSGRDDDRTLQANPVVLKRGSAGEVAFDLLGFVNVDPGQLDTSKIDLDLTTSGIQSTRVVPGEGSWATLSGDKASWVRFTPNSGFTKDPTSISYSVTHLDGEPKGSSSTISVDYLPIATADSLNNVPLGPITIDVLANDTTGDVIVPATLRFQGLAVGANIVASGQGVWSITGGKVVFTPEASYSGDPTPVSYVGDDNDGNIAGPALITVKYNNARTFIVRADDGNNGSREIVIVDNLPKNTFVASLNVTTTHDDADVSFGKIYFSGSSPNFSLITINAASKPILVGGFADISIKGTVRSTGRTGSRSIRVEAFDHNYNYAAGNYALISPITGTTQGSLTFTESVSLNNSAYVSGPNATTNSGAITSRTFSRTRNSLPFSHTAASQISLGKSIVVTHGTSTRTTIFDAGGKLVPIADSLAVEQINAVRPTVALRLPAMLEGVPESMTDLPKLLPRSDDAKSGALRGLNEMGRGSEATPNGVREDHDRLWSGFDPLSDSLGPVERSLTHPVWCELVDAAMADESRGDARRVR